MVLHVIRWIVIDLLKQVIIDQDCTVGLISCILRFFTLIHLIDRLVEGFYRLVPLLLLFHLSLVPCMLLSLFLLVPRHLLHSSRFRNVVGMLASRLLV